MGQHHQLCGGQLDRLWFALVEGGRQFGRNASGARQPDEEGLHRRRPERRGAGPDGVGGDDQAGVLNILEEQFHVPLGRIRGRVRRWFFHSQTQARLADFGHARGDPVRHLIGQRSQGRAAYGPRQPRVLLHQGPQPGLRRPRPAAPRERPQTFPALDSTPYAAVDGDCERRGEAPVALRWRPRPIRPRPLRPRPLRHLLRLMLQAQPGPAPPGPATTTNAPARRRSARCRAPPARSPRAQRRRLQHGQRGPRIPPRRTTLRPSWPELPLAAWQR